jgi:hypothetical protein
MSTFTHVQYERSIVVAGADLGGRNGRWVFSEPVDPVKLGIPDYFDVIKHPMDLGTVKAQLSSGEIDTPEKFKDKVIHPPWMLVSHCKQHCMKQHSCEWELE